MDYFEPKNVVNITKQPSIDKLGNLLHPTYPIEYVSVLGKSKSLDKTIRYANNRSVTPHYLTHNYKRKESSKNQYEPEHDGLLYLVLERIFADDELVSMLKANTCLKVASFTPVLLASEDGIDAVRILQFRYVEYPVVIEKILELFSNWPEQDDPELNISYAYEKLNHAGNMWVRFPSRSLVLRLPS